MIRKALVTDILNLIPIAKEHVEEIGYLDISTFSAIRMSNYFYECISNPNYICLVSDDLKGYMFGYTQMSRYNNDLMAIDDLLYVSKEKRGRLVGSQLIKEYIKQAKKRGCKEIQMTTVSDLFTDRTEKLYNKLGFKTTGIKSVMRV